jgi:hypothetical protein
MPANTDMATRADIRIFMIILLGCIFWALAVQAAECRLQRESSPHATRELHTGLHDCVMRPPSPDLRPWRTTVSYADFFSVAILVKSCSPCVTRRS